jgi:hypothetical protein
LPSFGSMGTRMNSYHYLVETLLLIRALRLDGRGALFFEGGWSSSLIDLLWPAARQELGRADISP